MNFSTESCVSVFFFSCEKWDISGSGSFLIQRKLLMTSVQTSRKINEEVVSGKPKAGCIVSMQYVPRATYLSFSLCTLLYVGKQPMLTSLYLSDAGSGMPCSVKSNFLRHCKYLQIKMSGPYWIFASWSVLITLGLWDTLWQKKLRWRSLYLLSFS